jgi:hypothetical protein
MRIKYLLLFHKHFPQLELLIGRLQSPWSDIFVHIDSKYPLSAFEVKRLSDFDVHILPQRLDIQWGGFRMVEATLHLLRAGVAGKGGKDDFLVLLSGQDLPIKDKATIYNYLLANRNYNFMNHYQLPCSMWADMDYGLDRIRYYWEIDKYGLAESARQVVSQRVSKYERRLFNTKIGYFGGSQWFIINRASAKDILEKVRKRPDWLAFFRYTYIPDELFFQTLLLNSRYADTTRNDNLKMMDWVSGPDFPRVFTIEDEVRIREAPELFARKFDMEVDGDIINRLAFE